MFNLTLVLQILNFLFAYWLLANCFFKPILNYIKQDEDQRNALEFGIEHYSSLLVDSHLKKQNLWVNAKKEFAQYMISNHDITIKPKVNNQIVLGVDSKSAIDDAQKTELVNILFTQIIATENRVK